MTINRRILFLSVVLFVALGLRLFWIYKYSSHELKGDPLYYSLTAQGIIHAGCYRNDNLFAFWPPLYSYFLAGAYSVFGQHDLPVKVLQALISTLTCLIMYCIAKGISKNEYMALFAFGMFSFYPPFIEYSGELLTETVFIFFVLSSILFLYKDRESPGLSFNGVFAGILLGLAALTREIALYYFAFVVLWMFMYRPHPVRRETNVLKIAIVTLSLVCTLLPWTMRNYMIFHSFVPISTNGGFNCFIGNNENATGGFAWKRRLPEGIRAWPNDVKGMPPAFYSRWEIELNRTSYKEAIDYFRHNIAKSIKFSAKKIYYLWRPPVEAIDYIAGKDTELGRVVFSLCWLVLYVILLISGAMGVYYSFGRGAAKWLLLQFWLLHVTVIHALTFSASRFQLPLVPVLILFSAIAFDTWLRRFRGIKTVPEGPVL